MTAVAEVLSQIACPVCGCAEHIWLERAAIVSWKIFNPSPHQRTIGLNRTSPRLDDCPEEHEMMEDYPENQREAHFTSGAVTRLACCNLEAHDGVSHTWACPEWVLEALNGE